MVFESCSTCGHGYGVHQRVCQPLRVVDGVMEFYQSLEETPDACTGYPDMMERDGKRCLCRRFTKAAALTPGATEQ